MFVFIKLGGTHELLLTSSAGIILPDQGTREDDETKLVALPGGKSQRIPISVLVPVLQLAKEDRSRDPASLLNRSKIKGEFWNVYGNVLRERIVQAS